MAGLAANGTSAQAKITEIKLPTASTWLVDMGDKSCLLARRFGTDAKPVLLGMRTYAPGYRFEITVSGMPARSLMAASKPTIAYGGGEPLPIYSHQPGKNRDYGTAIIFSNTMAMKAPPQDETEEDDEDPAPTVLDPAFEAQINRITLATGSQRFVLETGPMAKAIATVRQCTDGLARLWGLDPEVQANLSRPVTRDDDITWVRKIQRIYPLELMVERKEARVNMQIVVDKAGAPKRCDTAQAFKNTDFKVRACDIVLKDAHFRPALDKSGNPVDSFYMTTILYKMS
jgi:hypothetical protein